MRPAQSAKIHDKGVVKVARQLKARASDRRFHAHVPFGETYAMPQNPTAHTPTMGVHGWVFVLSVTVHTDGVEHWRGLAALRNGFSATPTTEDLDLLGLFVGAVTRDDPTVLSMLRDQLEGHRAPDGALHFFWFEGKNVPKSPLDSMLRTMGALVSHKIRELPDTELETMQKALSGIRTKLTLETPIDPNGEQELVDLLEKLDEAATLIEAEQDRRTAEGHEVTV